MKTSPQLQTVIEPLAKRHGRNLCQGEAHLRLALPGFARLVIETSGLRRIRVAHYFERNGDRMADPDVVFFTGYGAWAPIEITQVLIGYRRYPVLDEAGQTIERINLHGQADLAAFTEQWAQNLMAQGWLERVQRFAL